MEDPRIGSTSTSSAEKQQQTILCRATETIHCLQQVIHRFSDHHDRISTHDASVFWRSNKATINGDKENDTAPENGTATATVTTVSEEATSTSPNSNIIPNPTKNITLKDIVHRYAPVGLESQFEQLYCLLHPCLVVREHESNAAAFCLGHRGMGKSILVERCLQAFQDEIIASSSSSSSGDPTNTIHHNILNGQRRRLPMFRVVQVHGILIPGHDVSLVVKDILQQLSQAALQESATDDRKLSLVESPRNSSSSPCSMQQPQHQRREDLERQAAKRQKTRKEERSLRLRMSTFDSNLQLLGETLKLARVDQIPILIVLDEVDAFLGGSSSSDNHNNSNNTMGGTPMETVGGRDRQLLLYHLLDRVATQGSNICLIGLTQHLSLRSKLEKRIKSRMEGTSKEIFVGPCSSISSLTSVLLSHIQPSHTSSAVSPSSLSEERKTTQDPLAILHGQIAQIMSPPNAHEKHNDNTTANSAQRRVWETLEREYRMGRSVRWFSRIFTFSLSLYRVEWMQYRRRQRNAPTSEKPPVFEAGHVLDALIAQGASISTVPRGNGGGSKDQNNDKRKCNSSLTIMTGNGKQAPMAVDPRIQALLDLSAPQVALVLAARRILTRDAQWNGETTSPPPLTLGRMLQEYRNFRSNQQQYSRDLLWVAFQELLEVNVFRPVLDHCVTGPFHYEHQRNVYSSVNEAEDVPLHLLVDINRELMEALQSNVLECSTALREWGRKFNT